MDLDTAITLMLALVSNLQRVSSIITQARADGRDRLTPDEWAVIVSAADTARAALEPPTVSPPAGDSPALEGK